MVKMRQRDPNNYPKSSERVPFLFIQMEYCEGKSLKEAIDTKILKDEKSKLEEDLGV